MGEVSLKGDAVYIAAAKLKRLRRYLVGTIGANEKLAADPPAIAAYALARKTVGSS